MSKNPSDNSAGQPAPRRRRPWWARTLRFVAWLAGGLVVLAAAAVGIGVFLLTPGALTPMVSEYSSKYLDARVTARHVELHFWSTFPKVSLEVEGLEVVSNSLRGLTPQQRAMLPADADTLLRLERFSGGINVWAMTMGRLMLYDVELTRPEINLVKLDEAHANYDIFPPSDTTSAPMELPYVSIDRFAINGGAPVRFFSASDSINAAVELLTTRLTGSGAPLYTLAVAGGASASLPAAMQWAGVPFSIDGRIDWNQHHPNTVALDKLHLALGGVSAEVSARISFDNTMLLHGLTLYASQVRVADVISLLPPGSMPALDPLSTDITATLKAELLRPYDVGASAAIPSVRVSLSVPGGELTYDRVKLRHIAADIEATVNGSDPDASTLSIKNLEVHGRSLQFTLRADVTRPISDPAVKGHFHGLLCFDALPRQLLARLPFRISGTLTGDADVRLRTSDLTPKRFHRVSATGRLGLNDFHFGMADSSALAYVRRATLDFGTDMSARRDSVSIDSLLRVSLAADTLGLRADGIWLRASGLHTVLATRNTASSADTTRINPLGFSIKANMLALRADSDSMRVRLRDASALATLQRYNNEARAPLLKLNMHARRAIYADKASRVAFTDANIDATMHPRSRRRARRDSTLGATADSATIKARRARLRARIDSINRAHDNIDFDLDRSLASWLRRWQASANITASRGRMFTPYFPVRNTLRDVDLTVSTDSLTIRNTRYRMGRSGFLINGSVTNIARALTSRIGSPLRIDFDLKADTIDINQISKAIIAGSAYAQRVAGTDADTLSTDSSDEAMEQAVARATADTTVAPFIVPHNIDANLRFDAASTLYADIWFQRFTGNIHIRDGAVHLERLAGYTPMGSLDLTALYSGASPDSLRFAAGAVVRRLHLREFLHLMPEIDSVLPLLNEVNGIITAQVAMTTDLDSSMTIKFHTLNLVLKLMGDSLQLVDGNTFRTMAKWLMFKHRDRNIINSMQVELMIRDSKLDIFPFVFDIDRYRLGVSGYNTLDMDLNYHVAVLKSPLPFKFGINIKGHPGDLKIRLGKARFNEYAVASQRQLTDTARINLVRQIGKVFKFGVRSGHHTKLMMEAPRPDSAEYLVADTLTHADSVVLIQGGVIEGPPMPPFPEPDPATVKQSKKDKKKHKKDKKHSSDTDAYLRRDD